MTDPLSAPFGDADLPAAADLYVKVFNAAPWLDRWTVQTAHRRLAALWATPGACGVTVRASGELVGFALAQVEQWYVGEHCYLREMCVRADRQRTGVGTRLLADLAVQVPTATYLYLLTGRGTGAEAFYRRHGFTTSERMVVLGQTLD